MKRKELRETGVKMRKQGGERMTMRWAIVLVIAGLGGYKLVIALSRGYYNVLFLILMAVVALAVLGAMNPGKASPAK